MEDEYTSLASVTQLALSLQKLIALSSKVDSSKFTSW